MTSASSGAMIGEATNLCDTVGAARYVGLSTSNLTKRRLDGSGPAFVKLGRRVVYETADLQAWLARNRRRSTSDPGTLNGAA